MIEALRLRWTVTAIGRFHGSLWEKFSLLDRKFGQVHNRSAIRMRKNRLASESRGLREQLRPHSGTALPLI
jgi:hypothetical protein